MGGRLENKISRRAFLKRAGKTSAAIGLALLSGCGGSQGVRGRLGCTPGIAMFRSLPDYRNLGTHNTGSEKNGQVYTCKGGFIDIAHLRKGADFTNVYTKKFFTYLMQNKTEFSFKMKEPCTYFMKFDYSKNWQDMSEQSKKKVAEDVSIQIAEYASFLGTTWHEMLTWYGYKMTLIIPEYHSAFTIDDNFSNFLGARIAADVLKKNKRIFNNLEGKLDKKLFNENFTSALCNELEKLGALLPKGTKKATSKASNKDRCLNIGLSGYIKGYVLSGFGECGEAGPATYPAPSLDVSKYGFLVGLEIEPRDGAGRKMRKIAGKGKEQMVNPEKDFPVIMREIERSARKKGLNIVN